VDLVGGGRVPDDVGGVELAMRPALLWLLAVGCSSAAPPVGSCQVTRLGQCTEFFELTDGEVAAEKARCEQAGDSWSTKACDRTGSYGGCKLNDGRVINWFYPGGPLHSAAEVMTACNRNPYVAP
jgi:putative hemolysin